MKYPGKNEHGFSVIEVVMAIAVVALLGAGGWLVNRHNSHRSLSTTGCPTVITGSNSQIKAFIDAYKNGGSSSLKVQVECGTPESGGFVVAYSLTTSNKKINDSQYTYADASPAGPTTKHTCTLGSVSSTSAFVKCGGDKFNLYKS